jgi:ADP-heptose:LPS heptosyltransferase
VESKILLIRLKSIGDVLFTLPAVNLIRDNFPGARVTYLTSAENIQMVAGFSQLDEVFSIDRHQLRDRPIDGVKSFFKLLGRLRGERFSHVVDLQGYGETAFLTRWTGALHRWGSVYRPARRWAYTLGIDRDDRLHPGEWGRSLLIQCGLHATPVRNEFRLAEEHLRNARLFLTANGVDPGIPILYLQPFTSTPSRNWPLEAYRALAMEWRSRGVQVVFSGGPANRAALEPLRTDGFLVAAGLPRMTDAGLMKLSSLVVGGDTGFLHLATAMGTRVLMLKSPGSATWPFGHPDWVLAPEHSEPVASILLARVVEATAAILTGGGDRAGSRASIRPPVRLAQ